MPVREERVKLLLAPALGPLRKVLSLLARLPWPAPLQRATQRNVEKLKKRIPELAELLEEPKPRSRPRSQADTSAQVGALPELLERMLARDYASRLQAAQALANHGEPAAVDALISALRDRSVEVAVAAATSLSASGGERAGKALLEVLDNRDGYYHPLVRAAAVHGLGGVLPREQRTSIARALRDLDAEVSIAAIGALVSGAGRDDASALLGVVENTDGFYLPITRLAAARGLERMPPYDGIHELERVRAWEPDAAVGEVLERLLARARQQPRS